MKKHSDTDIKFAIIILIGVWIICAISGCTLHFGSKESKEEREWREFQNQLKTYEFRNGQWRESK